MSDEPTVQDFLDAQAHFRLPSLALVEKDWRVIRALKAITAIDAGPFRLVFAGGTCLARAHRLVRRMSEDVDFKIVSIDVDAVSGNKRRQQLGELRNQVTASLQAAGFPVDPTIHHSFDHATAIVIPSTIFTMSGPAGLGHHYVLRFRLN